MNNASPTVVVGYDGSEAATAAVGWGAAIAGTEGKLFVVTAFSQPPEWAGEPVAQHLLDESGGDGKVLLDEVAADLAELQVGHVETELIAGDPAEAIQSVATARDADLIVLGSHGRGRVGAAMLGSVVQRLLHEADRPVVVITERHAERLSESSAKVPVLREPAAN
jgi:nucleotide-binding universal stress UspA family protein